MDVGNLLPCYLLGTYYKNNYHHTDLDFEWIFLSTLKEMYERPPLSFQDKFLIYTSQPCI